MLRGDVFPGEFKDLLVGQLCYAANTFQTADKVDVNGICDAVLTLGICQLLIVYALLRTNSQCNNKSKGRGRGKDSRGHITKKLSSTRFGWAGKLFDILQPDADGYRHHVPRSAAAKAAMAAARAAHLAATTVAPTLPEEGLRLPTPAEFFLPPHLDISDIPLDAMLRDSYYKDNSAAVDLTAGFTTIEGGGVIAATFMDGLPTFFDEDQKLHELDVTPSEINDPWFAALESIPDLPSHDSGRPLW